MEERLGCIKDAAELALVASRRRNDVSFFGNAVSDHTADIPRCQCSVCFGEKTVTLLRRATCILFLSFYISTFSQFANANGSDFSHHTSYTHNACQST